MKHGRLNVGPSQSLQSLLDILEDLWTQAIHEVLEIKREDLKVGKSTGPSHSHLAMSMVHDVVETHAVVFKPTVVEQSCSRGVNGVRCFDLQGLRQSLN